MTLRERWLAVLHRQKPDRVPMDFWATKEATVKLMKYLGCKNKRQMLKKLHVDFVVRVEPRYIGPKLLPKTDVFSFKYRNVDYDTGVYRECILGVRRDLSISNHG